MRKRGVLRDAIAVVSSGDVSDCILWMGSLDRHGYGRTGSKLAHRVVYERVIGPIPNGQPLDHLCHDPAACPGGVTCTHRRCVNPRHLEPTDLATNTLRGNGLAARNARKTHCDNGHEFTPENTYSAKPGWRACRKCQAADVRAYKLRRAGS